MSQTDLVERCEQLERDKRNLQAELTARAKTLLRLRGALQEVHDNTEDEGDRVYFGSSNDADALHEVWHELDGWVWEDIINDGKLPDVYEASRKAHARADAAVAELASLRAELEQLRREAVEAMNEIDGEAPEKEPRDGWSSSDLDEAFQEGCVRGRWEMACIARAFVEKHQ